MYKKEIEEKLTKELEFSLEEEKLKTVIDILNQEILKSLEKRKEITEYILDYRKGILDEYRDDEDKVIEYFDHERFVKEEAFKNIDRKLKELNILKSSPYFGRVDFREKDFGIEKIYIGRFGVTLEESFEPLIIDWRAPIASLFYNGTLDESTYKAPMGTVKVNLLLKRQFIIKKGILEGMFDSAMNINDEILQMVLSKNSSEKLKDIIMTIQKEQDDIIRKEKNKVVVVDGVAGSGKTTIALHRVAYLLYNYRKILEDKVLILGPNNIFMDYISEVLPSLGESGTKQSTFLDFTLELLDIETVLTLKEVMEEILKGNEELSDDIAYKASLSYKNYLDTYVDNLDKNYFKYKDVIFRNKIVVSKEEMEKMFNEYFIALPLFRRSKKIKRIIYSKLKDARDEEFRKIEENYRKEKASIPKDELVFHINDLDFQRKLKIRELIEDLMSLKKELAYLNSPDIIDLYNEINNNKELHEGDLGAILYLKVKLEGLKLKEEIKHIVIDEAQDYSPLQFISIKELTGCKSFTIVGDSNQRILPLQGNVAMSNIEEYIEDVEVEHFNLYKSYRSTKEIMEYANNFLSGGNIVPLVRSGKEVQEINLENNDELNDRIVEIVDNMRAEKLENIAIITYNVEASRKLYERLKHKLNFKLVDKDYIQYSHGVVVIPSYFAKGLEFDGVIIVEENNAEKEYSNVDKLRYVMATRALHQLYTINNVK
ncbi:MAG: AAA family ATPase [Clostridium argentinense]|uniref:AAA family ATPase n=1 Tax=Clostridium faecium TaxID=2762223 RepID=A0ABR8YWZ8_9CLOT|nr:MULTISPECIES: UvrD-helicase domain-containing protein [Clostridium]MBD8048476.1 AAA family ATPase [Clostridium faecium]MBS5824671.1 AAA family ATPase [Clostridium argentinense]MDU1349317.1 AAA family ATPase [Clostridium argentinense]